MAQGRGTVNKVILLGRLGADPQLKYTPSGRATVNFNLATNQVWKDQEGKQQEKTDWSRVVAWGKLAEIMGEYLKKGGLVYIEGRLQTRSYEDTSGVKKFITEVVAQEMEMLGGGKRGESPEGAPEAPPAGEGVPDPSDVSDLPF
ncbi:single-stranded DNA-binding protein [bacterium]|nr:single-stranded DNA-binding protein [bacterium]